jgi:hypothetical protein
VFSRFSLLYNYYFCRKRTLKLCKIRELPAEDLSPYSYI